MFTLAAGSIAYCNTFADENNCVHFTEKRIVPSLQTQQKLSNHSLAMTLFEFNAVGDPTVWIYLVTLASLKLKMEKFCLHYTINNTVVYTK